MTVTNTTNFKEYQADGIATTFTIPFKLLDRADLQVYLDSVLLTTGFTVSGIGNPTSEIIFTTAPQGRLLLQRYIEPLRYTDYQDNGDLLAATINQDFDRIYMMLQGKDQNLKQALKIPEPDGINLLPTIAERANKLLSFDDNGEPLLVTISSGSSVELAKDLAVSTDAQKGAGMIGFANSLVYRANSVGWAIRQLINRLDTLKVGPPIFSVIWWPLRASIPKDYIAADGQELLQADYQEVYNGIISGLVPACPEADWQNTYSAPNNTNKRGCYVANSSSGKFRIPDYNGVHAGFIQATGAFLRGGINDSEAGVGRLNQMASHVHESMQIPTANLSINKSSDILTNYHDEQSTYIGGGMGRFTLTKPNTTVDSVRISTSKPTIPSDLTTGPFQDYDISNDKPTENYPNHYSGVWVIKIK